MEEPSRIERMVGEIVGLRMLVGALLEKQGDSEHIRKKLLVAIDTYEFEIYDQHKSATKTATYKESGGDEGIRTLDELLAHTPLAGERLRPLGHVSERGFMSNWGALQGKNAYILDYFYPLRPEHAQMMNSGLYEGKLSDMSRPARALERATARY